MKTLCFDVGGMSVKVGICENLQILYHASMPTDLKKSAPAMIEDMAKCALELLRLSKIGLSEIAGVGIGIPGVEDRAGNAYCVNIGWQGVPLKNELQKWIKRPAFVNNDANLAALAEHIAGACKGADSSITITLGTGIGGGIILNGRILSGSHGLGGEIGHTPFVYRGRKCTCTLRGCFERYASAAAFNKLARRESRKNPDSLLAQRAAKTSDITAKLVFECMREGDAASKAAFEKYIDCLAVGVAGLVNVFDPDIIAIGGGLSAAKEALLIPLREKVQQYRMFNAVPGTRITLATMGNDAGLVGADVYCTQNLK